MFKKILICLDGSKLAEEILQHVTDSCLVFQSEVILLHVTNSRITIPPPQSIHAFTSGTNYNPKTGRTPAADIGDEETLEPQAGIQLKSIENEQGDVRRYLDDLAKPFRANGLKVKTVVLEGDILDTILRYARENNVSLIAITSHGAGGLKRGTFGRISQAILKDVEIPVLLIKPAGKSE